MTAEARDDRSPITASLVESLNETIDVEGMQGAVRRQRVPQSALLLVVLAATMVALTLGFGFGVAKQRVGTALLAFCLLVSAIMHTILDLPGFS
jgi:hypothetical protein